MSDKRQDYISRDEYFMGVVVLSSMKSKDPNTHAELNAILNSCDPARLRGATLHIALFPSSECAKAVIQSGIKEVYYLSDKYRYSDSSRASGRMFAVAGVKYRHLESDRSGSYTRERQTGRMTRQTRLLQG